MPKMRYADWLATPYAKSSAQNTDSDFEKLLTKYRIVERQWTHHTGPNGRPAITLRINLKGKTYRLMAETLDVDRAEPRELMLQIKRVMLWTLKTLLEMAVVWGPEERLLLPFLESPDGGTAYEVIMPIIETVSQNEMLPQIRQKFLPALPAPIQ